LRVTYIAIPQREETTEQGKLAPDQDIQPGTLSGSVDTTNAMAGVGEKGSARAQTGKMAAVALATQVLLDAIRTGLQEPIDRLKLRLQFCIRLFLLKQKLSDRLDRTL
jgi:hypothetical protein